MSAANLTSLLLHHPLADDEVHLWFADHRLPQERLEEVTRWLSADERERAERFRFSRDRDRFRAGHGLLRWVLAHYLGAEPERLTLSRTAHGKLFLTGMEAVEGIEFNLSHSGNRTVFAVSRGRSVGVDVEEIRDDLDCASLAKSCFAPPEIAAWEGLPPSVRRTAFFDLWTRKEAYLKAMGTGLLCPLAGFAVSLDHSEVVILADDGAPAGISPLRVIPIDVGDGYAAALATCGDGWSVRYGILS